MGWWKARVPAIFHHQIINDIQNQIVTSDKHQGFTNLVHIFYQLHLNIFMGKDTFLILRNDAKAIGSHKGHGCTGPPFQGWCHQFVLHDSQLYADIFFIFQTGHQRLGQFRRHLLLLSVRTSRTVIQVHDRNDKLCKCQVRRHRISRKTDDRLVLYFT